MKIVIDIPEEQIKKSLEESKYINEDEGVKGSVHIAMLYTNARLEFVDVERKTDFYSCGYKMLPKGHGRLIDADALLEHSDGGDWNGVCYDTEYVKTRYIYNAPTIIEADKEADNDTLR